MRRTIRMLVGAAIVVVLLTMAAGADAGEAGGPGALRVSAVVGSDFRISGPNATSGEGESALVWNSTANEYLVVWQDGRNQSTRGSDIYGRRVSAAGSPVGADFRISGPNATSGEGESAVAWNSTANEYLVVWTDERNQSTRGNDVYGRRVSAAGSPVGGDFRISGPNATSSEGQSAVVWNSTANEYLVVKVDGRSESTRGYDVYGQRVSAAGSPVGADFRISGPNATSDDWWPALVWNGTANDYLVVWQDGRNQSTRGKDIYGRRVSAAGSPVGADFRISGPNATSGEGESAVAWNSTANEYLVVWTDERNQSTRGNDVYGRRVSAAGSPVGGDFRISGPNATSSEGQSAVVWNSTANEYLVVKVDGRSESTRGYDVYGQRVSAAGSRVGADFRISGPNATSDDWWPALVWNGTANDYLVVWQDGRNQSTRGNDIYGRRVAG